MTYGQTTVYGIRSTSPNAVITNENNFTLSSSIFAYGIYASGNNPTILNSGNFNLTSAYSFGIFTPSTTGTYTNIFNAGNFNVSGSISSAGIYTLGDNSTVTNTGTMNSYATGVSSDPTISFGIDAENASNVSISNKGSLNVFGNPAVADSIPIGIFSSGNNVSINNSGSINVSGGTGQYDPGTGVLIPPGGIVCYGCSGSITNSGSIIVSSVGTPAYGIYNNGTIENLLNSHTISSDSEGITNDSTGVIGSLINSATGTIAGTGDNGIQNNGTITSLVNFGSISGGNNPINNGGVISTLTNVGVIAGQIANNYSGSIGTINNLQGQGNSPLALNGNLPATYNIIINSHSSYGQFQVYGIGVDLMAFGIYGGGIAGVGASTLSKGTYFGVLIGDSGPNNGITPANLKNITGNYNGFTWKLVEVDAINSIWDLVVTGASTADTQQSLVNTAQVLQGTFTLQNSVLANSFSYDCNEFGANGICISAGGRNTAVSAANGLNNTSALLIAAYRPHPNYRIGAYADQNLSVNNAGSTVNLGNNTPLIGLFGAWNQRLDGTGTEVKVSAAYGQKNTTITRQVVGTSEPGSGSSQLNSQGAQVTAKYGFGVTPDVIVSPYIGMRYTQNNMNGYTEGASSSVTAPLTYSALNTNATTALAGVGVSYKVVPQVTTFASAGVESDTNTANGTYSATGINGLTPVNFNPNPVKTRPTATLGAYYDIVKNQRLGITGIYRQEPFQSVSTTTVMATYTVGL